MTVKRFIQAIAAIIIVLTISAGVVALNSPSPYPFIGE